MHRVYTDGDMNLLVGVACLAATGMSVSDMRRYVANGALGAAAADEQIQLLEERAERLAAEARLIKIRQQYVKIKIEFWRATAAGDDTEVARLTAAARDLAQKIKPVK